MPALNSDTGTKLCSSCKNEQSVSGYWKNSSSFDGLDYQCKDCKRKSRPSQDKTNAKIYARNWNRKKHTGFTSEEFEAKLVEQGGKCAICGTDEPGRNKDWNADHCHNTGQKRGLLCNKCNLGIGHLNDDPALLQAALNYLLRYTS